MVVVSREGPALTSTCVRSRRLLLMILLSYSFVLIRLSLLLLLLLPLLFEYTNSVCWVLRTATPCSLFQVDIKDMRHHAACFRLIRTEQFGSFSADKVEWQWQGCTWDFGAWPAESYTVNDIMHVFIYSFHVWLFCLFSRYYSFNAWKHLQAFSSHCFKPPSFVATRRSYTHVPATWLLVCPAEPLYRLVFTQAFVFIADTGA